jgi:hypothetical protein
MTQPRSNSRRFVNAAWSLLTFQLIASAGAVAVTGVAAFHVRNLVSGAQQADGTVDAAVEEAADAAASADPGVDAGLPQPPPPPPVNDGPGRLSLMNNGNGVIVSSLEDPDGLSQELTFTWMRDDGAVIQGATGSSYAFQSYDAGHTITAYATYVDGDGFRERTSAEIFIPLIIQ